MQVTSDVVLHCPEDTYTPMTYPLISHRKAAEAAWRVQTPGKASPETQRAGDIPGEQRRL